MEEKNIQIVRECIEQITNAKNFEKIYDYYSNECVFHTPPYVGLGFLPDDSSGKQLVIVSVAVHGPSAGKVMEGDVVLRARDDSGTWEGYDQLREGLWGQGKLGTKVTLTLLRNGETIETTIQRGRVEGFDNTMSELHDLWKHFLLAEMPDLRSEINQIIASENMVAFYATNTGTNMIYNQAAAWTECNILRMENGKIIEWWGVEDTLSQWRQMGFQFKEPQKTPA